MERDISLKTLFVLDLSLISDAGVRIAKVYLKAVANLLVTGTRLMGYAPYKTLDCNGNTRFGKCPCLYVLPRVDRQVPLT